MSLLRRKVWWRSIVGSRITLVILLLLCTALAVSVYDRYTIEREMAKRRDAKEEELRSLEERKQVLEEKVDYLSDERGIEAEVRQHFDVAREGEQVVILVDKERPTKKVEPLSSTSAPEVKSFWLRWWPW